MATPSPNDPTAPITPARFAAALKDLPIASLHLKVLELRNALLHLAHSNAQLQPFADGTEPTLDTAQTPGAPDQDCIDAIRENEAVMARMRHRIELVRAEVVGRGVSWREFEEEGDDEADEPGVSRRTDEAPVAAEEGSRPLTNGVSPHDRDENAATGANNTNTNTNGRSSTAARNPWTDGTFQVGTIRNGELHMDSAPPQQRLPNGAESVAAAVSATSNSTNTATTPHTVVSHTGSAGGGRLSDDELRRLLEVRLAEDGGDDEGEGLHL